MKVYGPYRYTDRSGKNRLLVNLVEAGVKRSQSYPRYLMEQHLGRKLSRDEDVDHIDRDPMNNEFSNLRVLSARENRGRHSKPAELHHFTCPICGTDAVRAARQVKHNLKQGKAGPFCGKKCARAWQASSRSPIGRRLRP